MSDETPDTSEAAPDEQPPVAAPAVAPPAVADAPAPPEAPDTQPSPEGVAASDAEGGDPDVMEVADAEEVQDFRARTKQAGDHQSWERKAKTIDKKHAKKNIAAPKGKPKAAEVVEKKVGAGTKVAGVFLEDSMKAERELQKKEAAKPKDPGPDLGGQANVSEERRTKVAGRSVS